MEEPVGHSIWGDGQLDGRTWEREAEVERNRRSLGLSKSKNREANEWEVIQGSLKSPSMVTGLPMNDRNIQERWVERKGARPIGWRRGRETETFPLDNTLW